MSTAQVIQDGVHIAKKTKVRWVILAVLFFITVINYADRAALSIAGPAIAKDLGLTSVGMGYIFSAFGWAYVACQIPGGWLLDRFGSRKVYAWSIFIWSLFTLLQGSVAFLAGTAAMVTLFGFRFLLGAAEAPSFPANSRIVAAWFPGHERGTASAIFNSAQYAAQVIFLPLMGWLVHSFGWPWVFYVMGGLGIAFTFVWNAIVYPPKTHPRINDAELNYIAEGGALVDLDQNLGGKAGQAEKSEGPDMGCIKQLLKNRMMIGIYLAQYCINALTYFFITWFPVYLVQERGMSILKAGFAAIVPALFGFAGGILGGIISDWILRKNFSLSVARKTPIIGGMLLSMSIIACNYVDTPMLVIGFMALAFFGKGIGALGWAVMSDTAPKQVAGLAGGLFNTCGNISSITTPIAIGYIVSITGSFAGALVYVGVHGLVAAISYLFIVGEIKRIELK